MSPPYLFIYGTLLQVGNPFADYLDKNSVFYGRGSFKGMLYDVGSYPGALYNEQTELQVYGSIVKMNNPDEVLAKLDPYEGIGPDEPEPHLYIRQIIPIKTAGEILDCWIYIYNLPVTGLFQIEHGDYLKHKKSP